MQYSIRATNYPFIAADMDNLSLPAALKAHHAKLFGLTIDPERRAAIRDERLSDSRYASRRQCRMEMNEVKSLFRNNNIRYLNSTNHSVEEIAAKIMDVLRIRQRIERILHGEDPRLLVISALVPFTIPMRRWSMRVG